MFGRLPATTDLPPSCCENTIAKAKGIKDNNSNSAYVIKLEN